MSYLGFATIIPYGNLVSLVTHPSITDNIITLITAWVLFIIVLSINLSLYLRVFNILYSKFSE